MSAELTALTLAALLQMLQFVLFAVPANLELGPDYTMGPRDAPPQRPLSTRTARLQRALNNHFESLILFAVAVGVLVLSDQTGPLTAACAWVYLGARILYVPAYVLGLAPWRSLIWALGFAAILVMLLSALV